MDINIVGVGQNSNIEAQVDPSYSALRASLRPLDFASGGLIGGHFYMASTFQNTAGQPAAGSQLFSVRWADSRFLFVLKRLSVAAATTTAFTNAQALDCDVVAARGYTTNPTGGTSIVPSAISQKARSNQMSQSLFAASGNVMVSAGTALVPGTQTLDVAPFGYAIVGNGAKTDANASYGAPVPLFVCNLMGQHPMIFSTNEGFVVRNGIALGAVGVVKYGFIMEWAEVPAY